MMKDAFDKPIELGDKVIYSTGGSGTTYVIGEVSKLHASDPNNSSYYPPDRVTIAPLYTTNRIGFSKNPILYASNVVVLEQID